MKTNQIQVALISFDCIAIEDFRAAHIRFENNPADICTKLTTGGMKRNRICSLILYNVGGGDGLLVGLLAWSWNRQITKGFGRVSTSLLSWLSSGHSMLICDLIYEQHHHKVWVLCRVITLCPVIFQYLMSVVDQSLNATFTMVQVPAMDMIRKLTSIESE
jgi:hypothetical protein